MGFERERKWEGVEGKFQSTSVSVSFVERTGEENVSGREDEWKLRVDLIWDPNFC